MSGGFTATCSSGTAIAAPSGLTGYDCCRSANAGAVTELVKIDWGCSGIFCSDPAGTVYMQVSPHGGSQTAECATGYSLSWSDD